MLPPKGLELHHLAIFPDLSDRARCAPSPSAGTGSCPAWAGKAVNNCWCYPIPELTRVSAFPPFAKCFFSFSLTSELRRVSRALG